MTGKHLKGIITTLVLLISVVSDQGRSAEVYAKSSTPVESLTINTSALSSIYNSVSEQNLSSADRTTSYILESIRHSSHTVNSSPDIYYFILKINNELPTPEGISYVNEVRENPGDKIIKYIHDQDGEKEGALL